MPIEAIHHVSKCNIWRPQLTTDLKARNGRHLINLRTKPPRYIQCSALVIQSNVASRPQRPCGLLGTGSPGRPLDFHTASELPTSSFRNVALTSREKVGNIRDREPRTSTSTFTQLLNSDQVTNIHFSSLEPDENPPNQACKRYTVYFY